MNIRRLRGCERKRRLCSLQEGYLHEGEVAFFGAFECHDPGLSPSCSVDATRAGGWREWRREWLAHRVCARSATAKGGSDHVVFVGGLRGGGTVDVPTVGVGVGQGGGGRDRGGVASAIVPNVHR